MSGQKPDLRQLDQAISSLADDAEGMHELITRSTDELERATAEGRQAVELANEALKMLVSTTDTLMSAIEGANGLLSKTSEVVGSFENDLERTRKEQKEAFDSFATTNQESFEKMRVKLQADILSQKEAIERTGEVVVETGKAVDGLVASVEQAQEAQKEAFDSFAASSLKASEKMRDDLQTDLLSHKTATAARMDSLEATMTKATGNLQFSLDALEGRVNGLSDMIDCKVDELQKKVSLPLYGVILVAVLQVVTLLALFLR